MTTTATSVSRRGPAGAPGVGAAGPPPRRSALWAARPAYALRTLIGALAVLSATWAIPPLVAGLDWLWPTVAVVAVIWLAGVTARRKLPGWLAVLIQVAAASVALTALFTVHGYGGLIPNSAAIAEFGDLLAGAWEQIRTSTSPAAGTTELALLITVSVGATALAVDALIAVFRAPALIALPLLCMYSVPASIDLSMLSWQAFALPAALYAMLLAVGSLAGRQHGAAAGAAVMISAAGMAALAIVAALLVSSTVTAIGTTGRIPRTGASPSGGVGISPFASLQGNLQKTEPVPMLRVTGLDHPDYLRTVGLQRWTPGEGWSVDSLAPGPLPTAPLGSEGPGEQQVTVIPVAFQDQFLPIYSDTRGIAGADTGWSYDQALGSVHREQPVTPNVYQLTVAPRQPDAAALRADSVTSDGALTETGELSAEVRELTEQVTAGATTAFDKADALRRWFTDPANGFRYSLSVPPGDSGDALVDFLRIRQGYCEQYASAMAVMLRAAGIPARVAIGFTQGEPDPSGDWVITSNDAHAWVEVLFTDAGWVRFDPTPLGTGQGGQQGFTESQPNPAATSAVPTPPTAASPGVPEELSPNRLGDNTPQLPEQQGDASRPDGPALSATMWWLLAIIALLAAAACAPTVARAIRRRRRQAVADAGGPDAAAAAWSEIEDLAVDHGIGLNPSDSTRMTANRLAKAAHLSDGDRAALRTIVTSAERAWYAESSQTSTTPVANDVAHIPVVVSTGPERGSGVARRDGRPGSVGSDGRSEHKRPDPAAGAARYWSGVEAIGRALGRYAPLSLRDRAFPRSVRPGRWRAEPEQPGDW